MRGLRARRCVEQGSHGEPIVDINNKQQGGVAMVKNVLVKISSTIRTALWAFGWISFVTAFLVLSTPVILKVILMSLARVLP